MGHAVAARANRLQVGFERARGQPPAAREDLAFALRQRGFEQLLRNPRQHHLAGRSRVQRQHLHGLIREAYGARWFHRQDADRPRARGHEQQRCLARVGGQRFEDRLCDRRELARHLALLGEPEVHEAQPERHIRAMAAVREATELESAHQAICGVDGDLQRARELAHRDGLIALA